MAWAATLPSVVAQLNSTLTAALAPTPVLVWSHAQATDYLEVVTVAFQDENVPEVAAGRFDSESYAAAPDRETYSIHCMAAVRNGSKDLNAAATRAFALQALVGGALAANHTLTGTVMTAHLGAWALSAVQDASGALAQLAFDIDIDAFTTT